MIEDILVIGTAGIVGFFAGNIMFYAFNHMPGAWLGMGQAKLGSQPAGQRIKSYPYKYILTATAIVMAIYIGLSDWERAPGIFAAVLFLAEIAMAGKICGVCPRELVWMLALTGLGILPFDRPLSGHVIGAGVGLALALLFPLLRKLIYKEKFAGGIPGLGMVIGFLAGWQTAILAIVIGACCAIMHAAWRRAKSPVKDENETGISGVGDATFFIALAAICCLAFDRVLPFI